MEFGVPVFGVLGFSIGALINNYLYYFGVSLS